MAAAAAASMTAALAEAEAAQRKMLEVDTTLSDLAAEALPLEEEQETQQAPRRRRRTSTRSVDGWVLLDQGYRCSYRRHT